MSDEANTSTAIVPAAPASSLNPAALGDKAAIEAMMAEGPNGSYYRGNAHHSAREIQSHYADLVRAEQHGKADPLGPEHGADIDVPNKPNGYQLEGLAIFNAKDRDIVDVFCREAHDASFGQQRFRSVVQWALQQTGPPTPAAFRKWAQGEGWSDTMIRRAVEIYRDMEKYV